MKIDPADLRTLCMRDPWREPSRMSRRMPACLLSLLVVVTSAHADLGPYVREWSVPSNPYGIREDATGSIWVAFALENVIRKYSPTGELLFEMGSSGTGPGEFDQPSDIVFSSSGDFFVADYVNHRIQKFAPVSTYITEWNIPAVRAPFIAIDDEDVLYVTDFSAGSGGQPPGRVWKFDSSGTPLTSWVAGSGLVANGIVFHGGSLYVVTYSDGKVWHYDPDGNLLGDFTPAFAIGSQQMAVDSCGRLHLAAEMDHLVSSFRITGDSLGTTGSQGSGPGQFMNPNGITVAKNGEIYVADGANERIQVFAGNATCSDAGRIAFASERDGDFEIYTMNPDGTGVVQLTDNTASDRYPAWSADGTKIAFSSDRDGDEEIHVMCADGTGQIQLTFNTIVDYIATC